MMSNDLRTYLLANSFTNVFVNHLPDTDADVIAIFDESAPVLSESVGLASDQAGLQVLVRSKNGQTVAETTQSIYNEVVGFRNDTLAEGGYFITQITPQQYPARVDVDERFRHTWSVHFIVRYTNNTPNRS
jgi:hypothetical protein